MTSNLRDKLFIGGGWTFGRSNLIIGGIASEFERGYFVSPTVFDDVSSEMSIAREEIFGPVLSVLPFSGEGEAAEIANDSNYGLAAGIFTSDIDCAMRFARDIQAGYVMINEYFTGGPGSPFGGYKQSGIGRERTPGAAKLYAGQERRGQGGTKFPRTREPRVKNSEEVHENDTRPSPLPPPQVAFLKHTVRAARVRLPRQMEVLITL